MVTALEVVGFALMVTGVALIATPAAFIAAGLFVVVAANAAERRVKK